MHDHAGPHILGTASTVVLLPMQEETQPYWHTAPCASYTSWKQLLDISDKRFGDNFHTALVSSKALEIAC
jgi:hypothetical protein